MLSEREEEMNFKIMVMFKIDLLFQKQGGQFEKEKNYFNCDDCKPFAYFLRGSKER